MPRGGPRCAGPAGGYDHLGGYCDDAEVEAYEGCRGERIGDSALEDEIDVHQAVADDRPAEGEGDEDQRKAGELSIRSGDGEIEQIGDDVEQGEGVIASRVPRVSHFSCCRSRADSARR